MYINVQLAQLVECGANNAKVTCSSKEVKKSRSQEVKKPLQSVDSKDFEKLVTDAKVLLCRYSMHALS